MCTPEFRKEKNCEDIFIPSFLVEAVEREKQEVERRRKYREMVEDMRTKNKAMLAIMIWRGIL